MIIRSLRTISVNSPPILLPPHFSDEEEVVPLSRVVDLIEITHDATDSVCNVCFRFPFPPRHFIRLRIVTADLPIPSIRVPFNYFVNSFRCLSIKHIPLIKENLHKFLTHYNIILQKTNSLLFMRRGVFD